MKINTRYHIPKNGKFFAIKANVDIPVYKVIKKFWGGTYWGWLYQTPCMFKDIEVNKVHTVTSLLNMTHSDTLNYGYHSFSSLRGAKKFKELFPTIKGIVIFKAIIPRGSIYYIGTQGEMISNSLKLIKEV